MFFFEGEGFSCNLDVLSYVGLEIRTVHFFSFIFFFNFWSSKLWLRIGSELDSLEMPDPCPDSMNPDPQHCILVKLSFSYS